MHFDQLTVIIITSYPSTETWSVTAQHQCLAKTYINFTCT